MAPVKIKHVVSFTSQDPKNPVEGLFGANPGAWLCSPRDRGGVLRAELQLERAAYIGYVDVGNCGSAFVQIDVGRSSWPLDQPYATLLPTATLMSPVESREGTARMGVRMFKKGDFLSEGERDSWDRVRVTCTQPFNTRVQFGLSFLRLRSPEAEDKGVSPRRGGGHESQGQRTADDAVLAVRDWLTSPAVQRTFFGPAKSQGVSEKAQKTLVGMSRAARMVLTAKRSRRPPSLNTPPPRGASTEHALNTPNSPPAKDDASTTPSSAQADGNRNVHPHTASKACLISSFSPKTTERPLKRKANCKTRQNQINATPGCKQKRSAGNKKRSPSPAPSPPPHAPPETEDADAESVCPICGEFFTEGYLPFHASSCQGGAESDTEALAAGVATSPGRSADPGSGPEEEEEEEEEEEVFPCPLCAFRFPASLIQRHASACGDLGESRVIWVD